MKINEYSAQLNEIDAKIEKLKEKKQTLNNKAYEEKLLTVEVGELVYEIENILSQKYGMREIAAYFHPLVVDSKVANLKMYVEYQKPIIEIRLFDRSHTNCIFDETLLIKIDQNTKTSDGKYLVDYLTLKSSQYGFKKHATIPEDMQDKLIVNLDPNAECFNKSIFKIAAFRCAKRKEKQQENEKTTEK